ncbi:flavodoxin [uncultured Succinivibrio sp.]|uniref:flavodoxin n=1 Tax=uncultured Succinivibrio sp. TaxID=540749 RepID=UPI0025E8F80E|nr:flavodoxin [uncultured Succinivibrio sp.]
MKRVMLKLFTSLIAVSIMICGFVSETYAASKDTLVVYFSATGNTRALASTAAAALGTDTFEIIPSKPYSADDLNYRDDNCRANAEQRDSALRPKIKDMNVDLKSYRTIVLAYPLWWAEEPRIIDTFIESFDFSGKTIVPVCTSGSSDIQKSVENIRTLIKGKPTVKDGKRFMPNSSKDEFKSWYDSI